jgi:hypothetical protein
MEKHRRGDDDGINVAGQHLVEVFVNRRILDRNPLLGLGDLFVKKIAQRHQARALVRDHETGYARAAAAGSKQANLNGRIGRRAANCRERHDRRRFHEGSPRDNALFTFHAIASVSSDIDCDHLRKRPAVAGS